MKHTNHPHQLIMTVRFRRLLCSLQGRCYPAVKGLKSTHEVYKMPPINTAHRNDSFYRYKMPSIELKHETNFTVIVNLSKIAHSLKRPISDLEKFFKHHLKTSVCKKGIRGF